MTLGNEKVRAVGALVYDDTGRLLLVRRRNEPGAGQWSIPGGRVEPGESDTQALIREMAEETGLTVAVGPLVGRVERGRYAIADYRATVLAGVLTPGDDATDARWCAEADLAALPLVADLVTTLAQWHALPGRATGTGRPGCSPTRASP